MTSTTLLILHSNDIHGRAEGLARLATRVEQARRAHAGPSLFFDLGDSEDTSNRLSNLTKGIAMHRLLGVAGCDAVVPGNAVLPRYGQQALAAQAAATPYPHLLANLRLPDGAPLPGAQPSALLDVGALRVGLIGVTAPLPHYTPFFNVQLRETLPLVRELAASLRQDGADVVVLLSHLGLEADRELAEGLQADVALILGAHSHSLLPEGEWVGAVLIAQAGNYAEHLGRVELVWDGEGIVELRARVLPVSEETPAAAPVLAEAERIEAEVEAFLATPVGELAEPLDYATDRECGVGNLMADALRERMGAEVAVLEVGHAWSGPLPAGPLTRGALWAVCPTTANPGEVTMTGAQLETLVRRGQDAARAAERPGPYRGLARGLIHLSGAALREGQLLVNGQPVEPERRYRVAGSDAEFEPTFGYVEAAWQLQPRYEVPTILREALEAYLAAHPRLRVAGGRLRASGGP